MTTKRKELQRLLKKSPGHSYKYNYSVDSKSDFTTNSRESPFSSSVAFASDFPSASESSRKLDLLTQGQESSFSSSVGPTNNLPFTMSGSGKLDLSE